MPEEMQTLDPVDHWSEIDPDYEDIPADPDDDDDLSDPDEELTEEEVTIPDDISGLAPFWAQYELWGQNMSADASWQRLAVEDFQGEFDVEVEGLTAGAQWAFRIRLIDQDGRFSAYSDVLTMTLPTDFTPPPAPTAPLHGANLGRDSIGWDGLLVGDTPADFSHTVLRLQQMHPVDDPDGEPGDPRNMHRFTGEGWWSAIGLPMALHRAFLVAVDTTGNESPWSDTVEFTPEPPFDASALEAELEDARDRLEQAEQDLASGMAERVAEIEYLRETRIPALQAALNTGLDDVYRDAQAYAEAQAANAVSQAAADAQSEYDRIQEIAERALSRAGDNTVEDPSFETTHWPDEWNGLGGFTVSRSTAEARTGDYQLRVVGAGQADLPLESLDAEPGMSFRVGIYWATLNYGSSGNTAWLVFKDTDTGADLAVSEPMGTSGYWSRVHVVLEVPEGVQSVTPVVRVDHGSSATLILEDVSVREVGAAAEALRAAEQARHEAQQAHELAGDALDTAANAYDAASAKSRVHWSLSAPSGTADSTDDVWWQYELRNNRRVVTGQWFWDNGVWRETEIAEEWLPLVNIGTGTYGDLHGDRLTSASVETRHLAVGDFENYLPEDALWDLRDEWTLSPLWRDRSQSANGFTTTTGQGGMPVALRWNGPVPENSGDARLEFRPGGRGMPVRPGDQVKLAGYGWRATGDPGDIGVRFALRNEGGGLVAWRPSSTGHVFESGWNDFEMQATVPDIDEIRFATIDFYGQADSNRGHWGNFELRRMGQGKFIADGTIQSRSVDTEEFFAAQAVIEKVWTDIVRSRLIESEGIITENMVATDAITARNLFITEEMVAEVVKVMRLEGDEMDFNVIRGMIVQAAQIEGSVFLSEDAQGNTTVRLDGMDNFLRGSIHAGVSDEAEIHLDYGWKTRRRGVTDEGDPAETWAAQTPYLNFHPGLEYQQDREPSIYIEEGDNQGRDGMMIINPGYPVGTPSFRSKLNVVGDVQSNRVEARSEVTSPTGFRLNTASGNQPGGIVRAENTRTRLQGRLPSMQGPHDMFMRGSSNETTTDPGIGSRGSTTFDEPSPTGVRVCTVSGHVANTSWGYDNNRVITVSSAAASASSVRYTRRAPADNNGPVQSWVYYFAQWV